MNERLTSRLGFLMLSAGCAVGLGNVWRFPYIVGRNGGAAFVLVYLAALAVLGFPLLAVELGIGRGGGHGIVLSLRKLGRSLPRFWWLVGLAAFAGDMLLMLYYTDVAGWLVRYAGAYLTASQPPALDAFRRNDFAEASFMLVTVAAATGVCLAGLVRGVERVSKVLMLSLLAIIAVVAVRACLLPGAERGLAFYLRPDWAAFMRNPLSAVLDAVGQAFFTLSVGIGAMTVFGSYTGRERSLAGEAVWIVVVDTFVALMSGLVVFPSCAAYGVDPSSGPGLIFAALPEVFSRMPGGSFWGFLFFAFLVMAAFTTVIGVFECLIGGVSEIGGLKRGVAAPLVGFVVAVGSMPCVLFDSALGWEDFAVSNIWLPVGALVQCAFVVLPWGWGWANCRNEISAGRGLSLPNWMRWHYAIVIPALIAIILVTGLW